MKIISTIRYSYIVYDWFIPLSKKDITNAIDSGNENLKNKSFSFTINRIMEKQTELQIIKAFIHKIMKNDNYEKNIIYIIFSYSRIDKKFLKEIGYVICYGNIIKNINVTIPRYNLPFSFF